LRTRYIEDAAQSTASTTYEKAAPQILQMPAKAQISPSILKWAFQRSHSSTSLIAKRLNVKQAKLEAWNDGSDHPTFRQAQSLADALSIPLGYLFLSKPPQREMALPDFRRVAGETPDITPDCIDAVNDVQLKQSWYHDFQHETNGPSVRVVGSFSRRNNPEDLGANVRERIGLTEEDQLNSSSSDEFLRFLVKKVETLGILVMRSGVVAGNTHRSLSVKEIRGFAISDSLAPAIFINSSDSKSAQLFTLAHELAHIWLGSSGISAVAVDPKLERVDEVAKLEWYCNRAAADVLLPSQLFRQVWSQLPASAKQRADTVARRFRVSNLAALIRAKDLDLIDEESAIALIDTERKQLDQLVAKPKSSGGDFYATFFARNSERLSTSLLGATKEGRVLYRDAARLLGVKVATIDKLVEKLSER
jgi:Zn-dependent peptidase ImmA (M78 family)